MTNTKTVYLRLQTPRLQVFCAALEKKILEGWEISIPAREGNTMFTLTLSKEVSTDSELPTKAVWSCKDEFEPEVLEEGNIAVIKAQELTDAPYPPLDTLELIPAVNTVEAEFAANLQEKIDNGLIDQKYTLTEDLTGVTLQDVLKEANIIDQAIKDGEFTELKFNDLPEELPKPTKSSNGFELREYSLEEVQKFSWAELTKINADLGLQKGKKPDMEVNIVEASKTQWGNK